MLIQIQLIEDNRVYMILTLIKLNSIGNTTLRQHKFHNVEKINLKCKEKRTPQIFLHSLGRATTSSIIIFRSSTSYRLVKELFRNNFKSSPCMLSARFHFCKNILAQQHQPLLHNQAANKLRAPLQL